MRHRRLVTSLLLAAYLPACAGYQASIQPPAELTAPPKPVKQMRVTLTDGSRVQVTSPRVEGDTLRGTEGYQRTSGPAVAIPLANITAVEVVPPSGMSPGAKTALIAGGIAGAILVGVMLSQLDDLPE